MKILLSSLPILAVATILATSPRVSPALETPPDDNLSQSTIVSQKTRVKKASKTKIHVISTTKPSSF